MCRIRYKTSYVDCINIFPVLQSFFLIPTFVFSSLKVHVLKINIDINLTCPVFD